MVTIKKPKMPTNKINQTDDDLDMLFKNEKRISTNDDSSKTNSDVEIRHREFDRIKEYYSDIKRSSEENKKIKDSIKQYSIYLPKEIQLKLKSKASENDESVSDVIRNLIIDNYLTDQEVKDAYNKGYDKRNK